jgi:nitrate reductase NapE
VEILNAGLRVRRIKYDAMNPRPTDSPEEERRREFLVFGFLALILAPILAVILVAGFGFAVWMYQLIAGPPGPPT